MNLHKRQHNIVKYALILLGLLALGGVEAKEKITFYEYDALGNIVAATDEQGEILWKEHYDPYGNRLVRDRASGDHRIWYTGHQETDIGLIYMGARHYDPTTGRFLSVDPLDFREGNIQSFNRYAYANNNPYSFIDPDGREAVYGTFYLQSVYHEAHTKAVNLWGSYFVKTSVIVGSSAVAPEAAVATKLSPYMARLLGLRALNRGREVVAKGKGDDLVRVRHHTSPDGARGIKKDGAINPGRGDPAGVHVETAPFGPSKSASAETGAFGKGRFVEFDVPRSSIQPTKVGPRNTGVIPTNKPLDIRNANPRFRRQ